jgi:hypothetical protein
MVKFTVETVEGESKEVKLMDYLPTRVGVKARSKLQVGMQTDGKKADVEMENALEKADNALLYIVEEMLDKSGEDVDIDSLAYESFQEIGQYYWKQVQGEKAKN